MAGQLRPQQKSIALTYERRIPSSASSVEKVVYTLHFTNNLPNNNEIPPFGVFEIYSIATRGSGFARQDKSKDAKITAAASGSVRVGPWTVEWTRLEQDGRLIVLKAIVETPEIATRVMSVL